MPTLHRRYGAKDGPFWQPGFPLRVLSKAVTSPLGAARGAGPPDVLAGK